MAKANFPNQFKQGKIHDYRHDQIHRLIPFSIKQNLSFLWAKADDPVIERPPPKVHILHLLSLTSRPFPQVRATEDAIASTAMSLGNSCFEGNKLWGGSILDDIADGCEELLDKSRFGRLFGVKDMGFVTSVFCRSQRRRGKGDLLKTICCSKKKSPQQHLKYNCGISLRLKKLELLIGYSYFCMNEISTGEVMMPDLLGYMWACLRIGKLGFLAILVSGGIVLQILACALYNNWWPMLSESLNSRVSFPASKVFATAHMKGDQLHALSVWVNATKFLTGASAIGSIAIPVILKHAGVIGWGALAMELSSFFVFVIAIMCYIGLNDDDDYSML
ncbi:hypothetical protein NC651_001542 [Populus alba x Populus x berolinensis]|nr:hypothetical protein NC651_001542 [Populus alba x Populus x berolinensis]